MCVIVWKPVNEEVTIGTLKNCWNRNKDGAGFMFCYKGQVYGEKGFMDFQDLIDTLDELGFIENGKVTKKKPILIHFRIATHGGVCPSHTHPFPVSSNMDDLLETEWTANIGVAHNGIIRGQNTRDNSVSDTMAFIVDVLARLEDEMYKNQGVKRLIANSINGSRLFIMFATGKVMRFGTGWVKEDGVWYSNDSFRTVKKQATQSTRTMDFHEYIEKYGTKAKVLDLRIEEDAKKYASINRKDGEYPPPAPAPKGEPPDGHKSWIGSFISKHMKKPE